MTKAELSKLRKKLPMRYAKTLAERTGHHPVYIYQVLTGVRNNQTILDAAITLAEEHKKEILDRKERINSI